MTAPSIVRRLRIRLEEAQAQRLRTQLAAEQARTRRLEQRVADLQAANEGAYRELREATGGPQFDEAQAFGRWPAKGGAA
ncbi:hypothetical protein [Streptomyces sp. NPDC002328]|uniref:hypothetical protein n=1 Tax=Streptomyces sp. NPDC002328 TaxID=3364642 RepID=UPI00368A1AFA